MHIQCTVLVFLSNSPVASLASNSHFRFPRLGKFEKSKQSGVKMKHFGVGSKGKDQPEFLKPKTVTLVDAIIEF